MKVKEETSRAGMVSHRIFSAGRGKRKTGRKFTAYALTTFMLVNTAFINGMFIVKPTEVSAAGDSGIDLEDGLVGYYSFDGTLENSIGTGSAVLHGGAGDTWNTPATGTAAYAQGKNGKAYSFTGDNGSVRGEGLQLDTVVANDEITISAWIKATNFGVATSSMIFSTSDGTNSVLSLNTLNGFNGSMLLGKIWDWENRNNTFVCLDGEKDGTKFTLNNWVHVTMTAKSGEQKLYFNGVQQSTSTSTNSLVIDSWKNQTIFVGINWWDESFAGLMDDVAIYNKALSAAEVTALYNKNGVPMSGASSIVTPAHVSVHDPSIIKEGDTYYIFGSHLAWAKTKDLIHWETFENNINKDFKTLFAKEAEWAAMVYSTYVVD